MFLRVILWSNLDVATDVDSLMARLSDIKRTYGNVSMFAGPVQLPDPEQEDSDPKACEGVGIVVKIDTPPSYKEMRRIQQEIDALDVAYRAVKVQNDWRIFSVLETLRTKRKRSEVEQNLLVEYEAYAQKVEPFRKKREELDTALEKAEESTVQSLEAIRRDIRLSFGLESHYAYGGTGSSFDHQNGICNAPRPCSW